MSIHDTHIQVSGRPQAAVQERGGCGQAPTKAGGKVGGQRGGAQIPRGL